MLKIFFVLLKRLSQSVIEIVFPKFCVGCKKLNTLLCYSCYEKIEFVQFSVKKEQKKIDSITCCCYYQTIAKKILHNFKYNSVIGFGKVIAFLMYYHTNIPQCDVITFVPIHKKKEGQRGFNQTQVIATELSKHLQIPVAELLIKTKNTKSQMSKHTKDERKENLQKSITINLRVPKNTTKKYNKILLIDDIYTTGETANYCTKILKGFGFKEIHVACFLLRN